MTVPVSGIPATAPGAPGGQAREPGPRIPAVAGGARPAPWLAESTPAAWDRRARTAGPDYLVADCGSPQSHEQRLHALLRLPIQPGDRVLELGCGTGRLADLVPAGVSYAGLDWSAEMIALARRRRPRGEFRVGSVADLSACDWAVASGPFNYSSGWSKPETARAVDAMWAASRRGIAVTFLHVPADGRLHYSAAEVAGLLDARDWSHLELDRSYLPNDICLRAWRRP